jgi:hypothetical protein
MSGVATSAHYSIPSSLRRPAPLSTDIGLKALRPPPWPPVSGARLRHQIDRTSELYKTVYKQRTATELINSQAVA